MTRGFSRQVQISPDAPGPGVQQSPDGFVFRPDEDGEGRDAKKKGRQPERQPAARDRSVPRKERYPDRFVFKPEGEPAPADGADPSGMSPEAQFLWDQSGRGVRPPSHEERYEDQKLGLYSPRHAPRMVDMAAGTDAAPETRERSVPRKERYPDRFVFAPDSPEAPEAPDPDREDPGFLSRVRETIQDTAGRRGPLSGIGRAADAVLPYLREDIAALEESIRTGILERIRARGEDVDERYLSDRGALLGDEAAADADPAEAPTDEYLQQMYPDDPEMQESARRYAKTAAEAPHEKPPVKESDAPGLFSRVMESERGDPGPRTVDEVAEAQPEEAADVIADEYLAQLYPDDPEMQAAARNFSEVIEASELLSSGDAEQIQENIHEGTKAFGHGFGMSLSPKNFAILWHAHLNERLPEGWQPDIKGNPVYQLGEKYEDALGSLAPSEEYQDKFWVEVAQAGGSFSAFIGASLAGPAAFGAVGRVGRAAGAGRLSSTANRVPGFEAAARAAGTRGVQQFGVSGTMAMAGGAGEVYNTAKEFKKQHPEVPLTEKEIFRQARSRGTLGGLIQIAPVAVALRPVANKAVGRASTAYLTRRMAEAGTSEWTVENAGAVMFNMARRSYDPDHSLWDHVPDRGNPAFFASAAIQAIMFPFLRKGPGAMNFRSPEADPEKTPGGKVVRDLGDNDILEAILVAEEKARSADKETAQKAHGLLGGLLLEAERREILDKVIDLPLQTQEAQEAKQRAEQAAAKSETPAKTFKESIVAERDDARTGFGDFVRRAEAPDGAPAEAQPGDPGDPAPAAMPETADQVTDAARQRVRGEIEGEGSTRVGSEQLAVVPASEEPGKFTVAHTAPDGTTEMVSEPLPMDQARAAAGRQADALIDKRYRLPRPGEVLDYPAPAFTPDQVSERLEPRVDDAVWQAGTEAAAEQLWREGLVHAEQVEAENRDMIGRLEQQLEDMKGKKGQGFSRARKQIREARDGLVTQADRVRGMYARQVQDRLEQIEAGKAKAPPREPAPGAASQTDEVSGHTIDDRGPGEGVAYPPDRRQDIEKRKEVEEMDPDEMRQEIERLRAEGRTDTLTGLKNRRAYNEAPRKAVQASLDVDSLKWVNDNLSHEAGDTLLQMIGSAFSGHPDAYRISGDEFVLQADTADDVYAAIQSAYDYLESHDIVYTDPAGVEHFFKGSFSYGTGQDLQAADRALQQHKSAREAAGDRAGRGEEPPGYHQAEPGREAEYTEEAPVAAPAEPAETQEAAARLKDPETTPLAEFDVGDANYMEMPGLRKLAKRLKVPGHAKKDVSWEDLMRRVNKGLGKYKGQPVIDSIESDGAAARKFAQGDRVALDMPGATGKRVEGVIRDARQVEPGRLSVTLTEGESTGHNYVVRASKLVKLDPAPAEAAAEPAAEPVSAKEPWQMTRDEYAAWTPAEYDGAARGTEGLSAKDMEDPSLRERYGLRLGGLLEKDARGAGTKHEYTGEIGDSVTLYRAVPEGVSHINPGEYATLSKAYAEEHLESHRTGRRVENRALVDGGHIISHTVPRSEVVVLAANELAWVPDDPRKAFIQQAIKGGKPVPESVLAEYPDLKPLTERGAEAQAFDALYEDPGGVVRQGRLEGEPVEIPDAPGDLNFVVRESVRQPGKYEVFNVEYGVPATDMIRDSKQEAVEAVRNWAGDQSANIKSLMQRRSRKYRKQMRDAEAEADLAAPASPEAAAGRVTDAAPVSDGGKWRFGKKRRPAQKSRPEYYEMFYPRRRKAVVPDSKTQLVWRDSFFSDLKYMVRLPEKPNLPESKAHLLREGDAAPNVLDLINETLSKPSVPARVMGETHVPEATRETAYAHVESEVGTRLYMSGYIDNILTHHPDAQPYMVNDGTGLLMFKKGDDVVGVVAALSPDTAPFPNDFQRQRIEEIYGPEAPAAESAAEPAAEPAPQERPGYGEANTVFTQEAADKARALLKKKLGSQLHMGIDPDVIQAGIQLAGYHIEAGARSFADYSRAMVADLGEVARPYLRSWYEGVRHYPGFNAEGMTPAAEIDRMQAEPAVETASTEAPAETAAEPAAAPAAEEAAEAPARAELFTADGDINIEATADFFADQLAHRSFKSITDARRLVHETDPRFRISADSMAAKHLEEAIEVGLVKRARETAAQPGKTPAQIYSELVDLYHRQPPLTKRTSTSMAEQAYSTPAPIAYVASRLSGIAAANQMPGNNLVADTAAGNAMLLIEVTDPAKALVNELNPDRARNLDLLGFEPIMSDATTLEMGEPRPPFVIINPPFGKVKDAQGKNKIWNIDGYETSEIDHAIVLHTLRQMAPDGKATLIIGGEQGDFATRQQAYRQKGNRRFWNRLLRDYNVTGHYSLSGGMYSRQGASFPIDIITIDGYNRTGAPSKAFPGADVPAVIQTFEELGGLLHEGDQPAVSQQQQGVGTEGRPDRPGDMGATAPGPGADPGDVSEPAGPARPVDGRPGAGVGESRPGGRGPGGPRRPRPGGRDTDVSPGEPSPGTGPADHDARPYEAAPDGTPRPGPGDVPPGTPPGPGAGPGTAGDTTGRVGQRDDAADDVGHKRVEPEAEATAFQQPYTPQSKQSSMHTLVPRNMADAIANALEDLETRRGPIDAFVAEQLGYDPANLGAHFAGEQIDAIGLALDNILRGAGFILGDQTGIGKGRVNAALIHYAKKRGWIPVFVTRNPGLYADMIRDLMDIGIEGFNPMVTNASLRGKDAIPLPDGRSLTTGPTGERARAMGDVVQHGLESGYDAVFTTYDQLNARGTGETDRQRFFKELGSRSLYVLDESHNAAGAKDDAKKAAQHPEKMPRSVVVRDALQNSPHGAFYSSATYAKRPDVMGLYFKTDMSLAVEDVTRLGEAVEKGGVPMQQAVAAMLAESGQMIRRERSFEGVDFNTVDAAVNQQAAADASSVMQAVRAFDERLADDVAAIDDDLATEGGTVAADDAVGQAGMESTRFTSVMHNLIDQFLLSAKAEATVGRALAARDAGEKPVIALANTMGSFLDQFADAHGLTTGDALSLDFAELFRRYLKRTREIRETDADGNQTRRWLEDHELSPETLEAYDQAMATIDAGDFAGMPVSPIDYIVQRLEAEGMRVGEMTGRTRRIRYDDGYVTGVIEGQKKANKVRLVSDFNAGDLDVVLLNSAGSTGISLHASELFADRKKRRMIVAQAEKNIDTFMQILGRIFRTGQVEMPAYELLYGDIPAEARPAGVLAKKMASLNANTTAGRRTALTAEDAADIFNEYGDEVVAQIMWENRRLHKRMGNPLPAKKAGRGLSPKDAVRKVTGRIPLLPIDQQRRLYDQIFAEYKEAVDALEKMGISVLEAQVMDYQAQTRRSMELTPAKEDAVTTPFAAPSRIEEVSVRKLGKPFTGTEVRTQVAEALGIPEDQAGDLDALQDAGQQYSRQLYQTLTPKVEAYIQKRMEGIHDADKQRAMAERLRGTAREVWTRLSRYPVGSPVRLTAGDSVFDAVVTRIVQKGRSENPAAASDWKITFAVNDASRQVTTSFSRIVPQSEGAEEGSSKFLVAAADESMADVLREFDEGRHESRETRYIVTGNILAGFDAVRNRGRIVNYTTDSGATEVGVLLPRDIDVNSLVSEQDVALSKVDQVFSFIGEASSEQGMAKVADKHLRLSKVGDNLYRFQASAARRKGGRYFLNPRILDIAGEDFVKAGEIMRLNVNEDTARRIVSQLMDEGVGWVADNFRPAAHEVTGGRTGAWESGSGEDAGGARFFRTPAGEVRPGAPAAGKLSRAMKSVADKQFPGLKGRVHVYQSEAEFPTRLRQVIDANNMAGGFAGVYWRGNIYFAANNISDANAMRAAYLEFLLRHEGRHMALDQIFGDRDARMAFFGEAAGHYRSDVDAYLSEWELADNAENRAMAAEEVLVDKIRRGRAGRFIDDLIARVVAWARKLFPGVKITAAEARNALARADSVIVSATGQPAYVGHGVAGRAAYTAAGAAQAHELVQAISSAATSIAQVPAAFKSKKINWGRVNVDIGGGRFNKGTEHLQQAHGTENLVLDPFNRDEAHNRAIFDRLRAGEQGDTVTALNVLNVIREPDVRTNLVLQAAKAVKPAGEAIFQVHEGDGSGTGKETAKGWQNNKKIREYVGEVQQHFDDVDVVRTEKGKSLIRARGPKNIESPALWMMTEGDPGVFFARDPGRPRRLVRGGSIAGRKFSVGKVIGGSLYVHRNYAKKQIGQPYIRAAQRFARENPGWRYNTVKYDPKAKTVRFDEAPDFDTAREPHPGRMLTVYPDGTVKTGSSAAIWHHKWQWVGDDYQGFDVAASREWTDQYRKAGVTNPKANRQAFMEQLERAGVPEARAFGRADGAGAADVQAADARVEWIQKGTDSRFFKKWFGRSAVADEQGRPMVAYHGTTADFAGFAPSTEVADIGFHFGTRHQAEARLENKAQRAAASDGRGFLTEPGDFTGSAVMPVYLSIQNPLVLPDAGMWDAGSIATILELQADQVDSRLTAAQKKAIKEIGYSDRINKTMRLQEYLQEIGFDGIQYQNKHEGGGTSYIAFTPGQVKSATGNAGVFDPAREDLRFARQKRKADDAAAPGAGEKQTYKEKDGRVYKWDYDTGEWVSLGQRTLAEIFKDERLREPDQTAEESQWEALRKLDPRRHYQTYVGDPLWQFFSETAPDAAGRKFQLIDRINRGLITDYRKDPEFVQLREETQTKIRIAQRKAGELAFEMAKFSRAEQIRIGQVVEGSVTMAPKRYESAMKAIESFQALEAELQELGILGPDNRFRQLTRKEIARKFSEIGEIEKQIARLEAKLQPVEKVVSRRAKRVSEAVTEAIHTDVIEGLPAGENIETRISKAVRLNEDRVREALLHRGFARGEADQMVERIKQSVVVPEGQQPTSDEGKTATEIKTTVERTIERSVSEVITKMKTYDKSVMARARGSIIKDINKLNKKRADILSRIQTHYKMSGKKYLRLTYDTKENNRKFLKDVRRALKPHRLEKGYDKQRKDLDAKWRWEHRQATPKRVLKGLSSEARDANLMRMFIQVAENDQWAVPANQIDSYIKKDSRYNKFKPMPASANLGPLSGMMVDPYIYDDINQSIEQRSDILKAYDELLSLWKTGKVVYNPAAQFRNIMSGLILANMGDLPAWRVDIYAKAAAELKNKGEVFTYLQDRGVLGSEWAGHEVTTFLDEAEALDPKDGSMYAQSAALARKLGGLPGKSYQGIEQFCKISLYMHGLERGMSKDKAAAHAEKWAFHYGKIPPAIRWAKRWYSPFITFTYKAMPRMVEVGVRKPWKMIKYLLLFNVVEEASRRFHGESEEDMEREKRVLPDYMRRVVIPGVPGLLPGAMSHMRVPVTDEYNQSKYLDLSFILPWGDIGETWGQSDFAFVPQSFLPSHPFWIVPAQVAFDEVMFTGQDLGKDWMSKSEYSKVIGKEVWRQLMPTLAGSYSYDKLMTALRGERDWAGRSRSVPEAVFDVFFGLRLRSIDYHEQLEWRLQEKTDTFRDLEREFVRDYRHIHMQAPSDDPEKQSRRERELYELYDERIQRMMDEVMDLTE